MSDSTPTLPNSPPPNSPQTASQLTLFAEGSLARTSPPQESGQEWAKAHAADYGASTPVLLANYDHATSSWKTSQHFLGEGLTVFSETWPRSGTMQSGTAYRLPPLVRLTDETGFGLWLTPRASDTGKGENNKTFLVRMNDRTDKCAQSLPTQVNNPKTWPKQTLWRTPCAGDAGRGVCASKETMDAKLEKGGQLSLSNQVKHQHLWPTPRAADHKGAINPAAAEKAKQRGFSPNLPEMVTAVNGGMWPTPTSRDYRSSMKLETVDKRQAASSRGVNLSEHIQKVERNNGALNPTWVEWLMGFPLGWTDLNHSETPLSPKSQSLLDEQS